MVAQLLVQIDVGFSAQVALFGLWKLVVEETLHYSCTDIGNVMQFTFSLKEITDTAPDVSRILAAL